MRIRTTDCCSTQKGSGFVMTQEQSKQTECQTLIFCVRISLPGILYRWKAGRDFADARGTLFFEIARLVADKRPAYFILENVPGLLSHDKGRTFSHHPSVRYLSWGTVWNGKCLTARIFGVPQSRKAGGILSDILIEDVPEKYYLSQQQMERLLYKVRTGRQGNESTSPEGLSCTLTIVAGGMGGKTGLYEMGVPIKGEYQAGI